MKIGIATMGSRGDVQPYVVLGKALKERGHEVTISAPKNFESLVNEFGLRFHPVKADYQELLNSDESKRILGANPFTVNKNLKKTIYPIIEQSLNEFYELGNQSDKLIYHPKTLADVFADQMPEKMIRAAVVPALQPTYEFPNPAFSGLPIPFFLNKLSYKLTDLIMKMLKGPIRNFRKDHNFPISYKKIETPFIYGISTKFLKQPKDYPPHHSFTGFWLSESNQKLPSELEAFIESKEKVVLITFGSMLVANKIDISELVDYVTKTLKIAVVLIKGWGIKETGFIGGNENVFVIDSAPFDKLFPKVTAVVHHGGVGTTAECLRSGKPMLICPILYPVGDQLFWGEQAYKKEVAVKPLIAKRISKENFIHRIEELLSNKRLYSKSQKLAKQINQERGLEKAVKIIEN